VELDGFGLTIGELGSLGDLSLERAQGVLGELHLLDRHLVGIFDDAEQTPRFVLGLEEIGEAADHGFPVITAVGSVSVLFEVEAETVQHSLVGVELGNTN
jgi:hypothetical protein